VAKDSIIVVGGGASGMMCSILCAREGIDVTIIEKLPSLGKKILVTGNGRCNITNSSIEYSNFYSNDEYFYRYAIDRFGFEECREFFASIGLDIISIKDTKYYPMSLQASSVVELMEHEIDRLGIKVLTDTKIKSIKKSQDKFAIDIGNRVLKSNNLLIATGGKGAKHLGSDADGYRYAKSLGHTITDTYPTLVQLLSDEPYLSRVAGVKVTTTVSLVVDNKIINTLDGDVLFAKYGVSGNTILDLSREAKKALIAKKDVQISIDLLPHIDKEYIDSYLVDRFERYPKKLLSESLIGVINKKLIPIVVQNSISHDKNVANISKKERKNLIKLLEDFRVSITDTHEYAKSEATAGGVDTKDIDPKSMQSKKIANLYFAGEVVDVDGDCGGYNLHWAWASGSLVANSIVSKE
jgi:predicted Rossmann fold flavoprotein